MYGVRKPSRQHDQVAEYDVCFVHLSLLTLITEPQCLAVLLFKRFCMLTRLAAQLQFKRVFSTMDIASLPVFDINAFTHLQPDAALSQEHQESCQRLAKCLHETGCLIVSESVVVT